MRNKYSLDFKNQMVELAHSMTLNELLNVAKTKYKYNITKNDLRNYLSRRKIRYKGYNINKAKDMGSKIPIGTEYVKDDGMVLVKIAKDKWEYKQRMIYEQYHNVELTSDDYIIFLDQDRSNFNINNLRRINRRESSIIANQKLFSNQPIITETGIDIARLMIKTKDRKKELSK